MRSLLARCFSENHVEGQPLTKIDWLAFIRFVRDSETRNMNQLDHFKEIIASYKKHGWQVRRVLMCDETMSLLANSSEREFEGIAPEPAKVDALWFSRPSHAGREAWELRHVSETPYALFEAFEGDVIEELRSERLREMEASLIEYASRA